MRAARFFSWLSIGAAIVSGCTSATTTSPDKACTDFAVATCTRRQTCFMGARVTRDYGTLDTCVAREKLLCTNALSAAHTGASADGYLACAAAVPSESCPDFFLGNVASECIFHGTLGTGAPCVFNGQCQSTMCLVPKGASCGTCGPQPAVGDSCIGGCGRGLICSDAGLCVLEGGAGALCDANHPCAFGFGCVGEVAATMTMGTCQSGGTAVGAACTREPMGAGCDGRMGLYCNATTSQCAMIAYGADGQPCGVIDRASVGCIGGGLCVIADGATAGVCSAPAADGAACDSTNGPPCLAPARCVTGGGAATAGVCQVSNASSCS